MAAAPETVAHTALRAPTPIAALSVLVVEPLLDQLLQTVTTLSTAGFKVTAAASFEQAKPLLTQDSPSVLLTALRLGMYNGLHLVVRGKALQPGLAALVTSPQPDVVLQREAELLDATFVLQPLASAELIASILKTRFRREGEAPIRPPFERRATDRRALKPIEDIPAETPINLDRRESDRRRALPWLVPPAPRAT